MLAQVEEELNRKAAEAIANKMPLEDIHAAEKAVEQAALKRKTFIVDTEKRSKKRKTTSQEEFNAFVEESYTKKNIVVSKRQMMTKMQEHLKKCRLPKGINLRNMKYEEMKDLYRQYASCEDLFGERAAEAARRNLRQLNEDIDTSVLVARRSYQHTRLEVMNEIEREKFFAELVEAKKDEAAQYIILGEFNKEFDEEKKFPLKEWNFKHQEDGTVRNTLIRGDNSTLEFKRLEEVLEVLDRDELEGLYRVVKEYYKNSKPQGGETVLIDELNSLFDESMDESETWDLQDDWEIIEWKFFESCGVHVIYMMDGFMLYMTADRKYPLTKKNWEQMLKMKMA